ncbi:MAG: hypothetical protein ABI658_20020 [Acidimicrobiales bacterium]
MLTTPTRRSQSGSLPAGHRFVAFGSPRVPAAFMAAIGLLALYVALSFLDSPRGFLGTDTGGKVATLEVMRDRGTADPDVGYWAAAYDPDAVLHPLYYTSHVGDRYVNLTTLPMPLLVRPLYSHFGYRAALLVPMLGAVASALAARALARRLGASGWLAFVVVGTASPVLIYALDLWEHALGLGAMAWAVVVALDVRQARLRPQWGLAAGLLFGVAGTMRTEALLYGAWCVAFLAALLWRSHRKWRPPLVMGVSALVGVMLPLGANSVLERVVMGHTLRAGRAIGTAQGSGTDFTLRAREAITTTVGVRGLSDIRTEALLGLLFVGAIVATLSCATSTRRQSMAPKLAGLTIAIFVLLCTLGWGFVPGLLIASPFAAAGLTALRERSASRELALLALGPLPLVWAVQFTGGAGPQWGGRYELLSGFVLTVVGVAAISQHRRWVQVWAITVALAMTTFGVGWMVLRTHTIDDASRQIAARPEQLVVSTWSHLFREGGAYYTPDRRWLTAETREQLDRALEIARAEGLDTIAIVSVGPNAIDPGPGYATVRVDHLAFFADEPITVAVVQPIEGD